jgi:DNA-binding XRE family transcriptional regulator/quercetin dioxygenase-like cupin family protein
MQEALQPLAEKIQRLRIQRGLSLSSLARAANVSKSTVFKLERAQANPSMDTLWSLANALNVPFASLFIADGEHPVIEVLRYESATKVVRDGRGAFLGKNPKHDPHFVIRHVLSRHDRGEVEVYSVEIDPRTDREAAAHSNGVIEHAYVNTGRIEIRVGEVVEQLGEGDRMTFLADRPHTYRALENRAARFIVLLDYP